MRCWVVGQDWYSLCSTSISWWVSSPFSHRSPPAPHTPTSGSLAVSYLGVLVWIICRLSDGSSGIRRHLDRRHRVVVAHNMYVPTYIWFYSRMIQIYTNLTLITSDWHYVIKPNVEVICFIFISSPSSSLSIWSDLCVVYFRPKVLKWNPRVEKLHDITAFCKVVLKLFFYESVLVFFELNRQRRKSWTLNTQQSGQNKT